MKTRPFHFQPENQRRPKLTAEKNRKNLSWNAARPNFTQFNSKGLEHRRLEVIGQYILSIRRIQPALKPWCCLLSQALVMRQIPEGQQRPAAQLASTEDDWVLMGSPKHGQIVAWHGMTFWKVEQLNWMISWWPISINPQSPDVARSHGHETQDAGALVTRQISLWSADGQAHLAVGTYHHGQMT